MADVNGTERRAEAERIAAARRAALDAASTGVQEAGFMSLGTGIDQDDYQYRRLTSGAKFRTRDLSSLTQDRQLEVSWYLFESNPFAHRLITLMTDLIIGEGAQVEVMVDDQRVQAAVNTFWGRNQMPQRMREFYMANSLNGELIFPVAVNEVTGTPVLGYLDSVQVKAIRPLDGNVLHLDKMILKPFGPGDAETTLDIIREDPATGRLAGNVFYHRINALPNSLRGRSDLMPLADWLDLYDQFMFAEVERLNLISAFAWDYTIEGAKDDAEIQAKIKRLPKLKPGAVFGHNEKEKLEARTPDLKATDRSEVARMLRVHIAGSMGFPVSYLGDTDSNRATIEGQNDVMLKTPAARQKEFGGFLNQMVRYTVEQVLGKNPALFVDAQPRFRITMPEIQAKDVSRVGTVMASVMTAMDSGIANKTVSRKLAIRVIAGLIKQLGIDADPAEIAAEIEDEAGDQANAEDLLQAELARLKSGQDNLDPPDPDAEGDLATD